MTTVTQDTVTSMDTIVSQLSAAQAQAKAAVDSTSEFGAWLIGTGSSRDAQYTLLNQTGVAIGNLAAQEIEVISGQRSYSNWYAYAESIRKQIASVAPDVANWSLGGVVDSTASQTASDVKTGVAVGAAVLTPILLFIGGLYLFLVLGVGRGKVAG